MKVVDVRDIGPVNRRRVGRPGKAGMGRIVVRTRVTNLFDEDKSLECGMFVDTGAGALILPAAW